MLHTPGLMGLYFPLFNFTIVFTRTVLIIMNEPKKLNHFKIVLSHVGSVTERSGAPFYGHHNDSKGRGSTPTLDMLLCPWIRYFTIFVAAWWLKHAANSTKDKKRNLRKVNSRASENI